MTNQSSHDSHWSDWLPTLAWLPIALAPTWITNFGRLYQAMTFRWVGLFILVLYGLIGLASSKKWSLMSFDYFAFFIFSLVFFTSVNRSNLEGIYMAFSCVLTYLYLTWGLGYIATNYQRLMSIIEKLLFIIFIIFLVGILGNLSGAIPSSRSAFSGIFANPNTTSLLAARFLPIAIYFFNKEYPSKRLLGLSSTLILLFAIILSQTRSTLLAIVIWFIYYLVSWSARLKWEGKLKLDPVVLLALIFLPFALWINTQNFNNNFYPKFISSLTDPNATGFSTYRFNVAWPLYLQEINKSWLTFLLGHSWGSEKIFSIEAINRGLLPERFGHAHSAYIGLTYQIGILGSLLVFLPIWILVLRKTKNPMILYNKNIFEFEMALKGSILVGLITAFFETGGIYNIGAEFTVPFWIFVYALVRLKNLKAAH